MSNSYDPTRGLATAPEVRAATTQRGTRTAVTQQQQAAQQAAAYAQRANQLAAQLEQMRAREAQNASTLRNMTENFSRAKSELQRYQQAWAQVVEREQWVQQIVAESKQKMTLAEELRNEIAMLRGDYACERSAREDAARINKQLETEFTKAQTLLLTTQERLAKLEAERGSLQRHADNLQKLLETAQSEARKAREEGNELTRKEFEILAAQAREAHARELQSLREQSERLLTETASRASEEARAQRAQADRLLTECERRHEQERDRARQESETMLAAVEARYRKDLEEQRQRHDAAFDQERRDNYKRANELVADHREAALRAAKETTEWNARVRALEAEIANLRKEAAVGAAELASKKREAAQAANDLRERVAELEARNKEQADLLADRAMMPPPPRPMALPPEVTRAIDAMAESKNQRMTALESQLKIMREILVEEKKRLAALAERASDPELTREEIVEALAEVSKIERVQA